MLYYPYNIIIIIVIATIIIFIYNFNYLKYTTTIQNDVPELKDKSQSINYYELVEQFVPENKPNKYILLWSKFFSLKNWEIIPNDDSISTYDHKFFEEMKCPEINCILTSNRSLLNNLYEYDAIIFHGVEKHDKKNPMPKQRSPFQKYIMGALETPRHFRHKFNLDNKFYNWTMTFKTNSDILWPYSTVYDKELNFDVAPMRFVNWRPIESFNDDAMLNLIKNKSKMAAQFVSHCNAESKRDTLTKTLQKYISVDVYGKCGPLQCNRFNNSCDEILDRDYKFFFAFENDLCEDYVTEKFYNSLDRLIIPVVFGGGNYSRFAPPGSYIDANDFKTIKKLADYLIFLAKNPKVYMKSFWWKKYYEIHKTRNSAFCDLCVKLQSPGLQQKIEYYDDIKAWYSETCDIKRKISFE